MGAIIQIYMGVLTGESRRPRKLLPKLYISFMYLLIEFSDRSHDTSLNRESLKMGRNRKSGDNTFQQCLSTQLSHNVCSWYSFLLGESSPWRALHQSRLHSLRNLTVISAT